MATFEPKAVDLELATHLVRHAADELARIETSMAAAVDDAVETMQLNGASGVAVMEAMTSFAPAMKLLKETRELLEKRRCRCPEVERVALDASDAMIVEAQQLRERALSLAGEPPRRLATVIDLGVRIKRMQPRDLLLQPDPPGGAA